MMQRFSVRLALAAGLLVPLAVLAAGIFPDVSDDYPFKDEIESLARAGVVKGNPDGKYLPEKSVNRAEFLKLLYTATGKQPKAIYAGCFSDVERGSWYESFVCDAAAKENGFVQGYSDGKFRPGSPVNRTEALKMVFTVFGLPVSDITTMDQDIIKFVDVSVTAWYSKYLSAAYAVGILPIDGQGGSRFYPDKELTRGEAAAYIYNAMHAKTSVQSSSSSSVASSVASSSSSSEEAEKDTLKQVAFPFTDTDQFDNKKTMSYAFSLKDSKTVVHIDAAIVGYYQVEITCRLYRLSEEGFSYEYYLGVQPSNSCAINVAIPAGSYQLQLQPLAPDASYTVTASKGVSDGNDGFMEAVTLKMNIPRTAVLDHNDLYDWYTVTVSKEQTATISVSSGEAMACIIYSPPTVDQYGFSGPQCGTPYLFAEGTYTVGIGRKGTDLLQTITYTVNWK